MVCKYCKREIDDDSIFCKYCGEKLIRSKNKPINVPKPIRMADGRYTAQIMIDGKRTRIYGDSEKEYCINARAFKIGSLEAKKNPSAPTLGSAIDSYIEANENVLSPSTIRGYRTIRKYRFKDYMDCKITEINWQAMINSEVPIVSAKTISNAWNLVSPSLSAVGYKAPIINLPKKQVRDMNFLDYQQIGVFLEAIKGHTGELAAILALHSLRMSELIAVTVDDVVGGYISVNKAIVPDQNNIMTERNVNKTYYSTRKIPIMIPRLLELLPESGRLVNIVPVTIEKEISKACERAKLQHITPHDLRRSFASLGYHLGWKERSIMKIGGWSNMTTVHNIYIKLSNSDLEKDIQSMKDFYNFT